MSYSTSQMHDFYEALGGGDVKPSGVMNYIQHLFIAEHCAVVNRPRVLDVCCGRGLMVPLLKRFAPQIRYYVGLDICHAHLLQVIQTALRGDGCTPRFPVYLLNADASTLDSKFAITFDVIIYTSALEHLPKEAALASIRAVSKSLSGGGVLFLSTPNTPTTEPPTLQYRVHVFEWDRTDLRRVIEGCGLDIVDEIGLLPPRQSDLTSAMSDLVGLNGLAIIARLQRKVPYSFLGPVLSACYPEVSREVLFVCTKRS